MKAKGGDAAKRGNGKRKAASAVPKAVGPATWDDPVRRIFVTDGKRDFRLFLIAGEHSGDALGGKLMEAINARLKDRVRYLGVGGEQMEKQGLISQFPISDVAVMGPLSILPRLPKLARRVWRTVDAAVAAEPDAIVIIDSPEFTHPIAKRIRKRTPAVPIINYVSPSVWAWRPGRAKKMTAYVDHVLALLPFEPDAHARLGGPECTYVGHPLAERLPYFRALDPDPLRQRLKLDPERPVLVVLPGSRRSEIERMTEPFGAAIATLKSRGLDPQIIVPAISSVRDLVEARVGSWPQRVHIIDNEDDKFRAFKMARAALATSGTVTLELGLTGTPMVVGYRVDALAARLRFLMTAPSIVLPNLVLGNNAFPEFTQEKCTGETLADAIELLLLETPERTAQLEALARIPERIANIRLRPSVAAAEIVLRYADVGRTLSRAR